MTVGTHYRNTKILNINKLSNIFPSNNLRNEMLIISCALHVRNKMT